MQHEKRPETTLTTLATEHTEPGNGEQQAVPELKERTRREVTIAIAERLGETEPGPRQQIFKIVYTLGRTQAIALLEQTLQMEQSGGLMLPDGSRRRTPGGVFFHLAYTTGTPKPGKTLKRPPFQPASKPAPAATTKTDSSPGTPPIAWQWQDRLAEITELRTQQGATSVKITLIGRPGRIANHGTFILTTMQSSKVPSLPKGMPTPPQAGTTYSVYIAAKQWKKVEESLRNPEDILIAEGYPVADPKTGTIAVFVTSTATKLLQAAQREQQKAAAAASTDSDHL